MKVVSNTTPLNYLILIGHIEILNSLYDQVVIPEAVFRELSSENAPDLVRRWVANRPSWLIIDDAPQTFDNELDGIQVGERETILLAELLRADFVIIDDRKARHLASKRGVNVIGTLGILTIAAQKGLINPSEALDALRRTSFRASSELFERLLRDYR